LPRSGSSAENSTVDHGPDRGLKLREKERTRGSAPEVSARPSGESFPSAAASRSNSSAGILGSWDDAMGGSDSERYSRPASIGARRTFFSGLDGHAPPSAAGTGRASWVPKIRLTVSRSLAVSTSPMRINVMLPGT
jgi:hypothetical protein